MYDIAFRKNKKKHMRKEDYTRWIPYLLEGKFLELEDDLALSLIFASTYLNILNKRLSKDEIPMQFWPEISDLNSKYPDYYFALIEHKEVNV